MGEEAITAAKFASYNILRFNSLFLDIKIYSFDSGSLLSIVSLNFFKRQKKVALK